MYSVCFPPAGCRHARPVAILVIIIYRQARMIRRIRLVSCRCQWCPDHPGTDRGETRCRTLTSPLHRRQTQLRRQRYDNVMTILTVECNCVVSSLMNGVPPLLLYGRCSRTAVRFLTLSICVKPRAHRLGGLQRSRCCQRMLTFPSRRYLCTHATANTLRCLSFGRMQTW